MSTYGYSTLRGDTVLHRVNAIRSTPDGDRVNFACPNNAFRWLADVVLTDDPTARRACPYCAVGVEQIAPEVVYAGTRAGMLKVGCTKDLGARLGAQKLTLVAQAPGSFDDEADLIRRLGTPAKGREWFRWDGDAALVVIGWMASRRNLEAAA